MFCSIFDILFAIVLSPSCLPKDSVQALWLSQLSSFGQAQQVSISYCAGHMDMHIVLSLSCLS